MSDMHIYFPPFKLLIHACMHAYICIDLSIYKLLIMNRSCTSMHACSYIFSLLSVLF